MEKSMNYYKDSNGNVYAYDDEQVDQGYAMGKTSLTTDEVDSHLNPQPTPEQLQELVNAESRAYLASTDWYVIRWQENGTPIPEDISTARTEARANVIEV